MLEASHQIGRTGRYSRANRAIALVVIAFFGLHLSRFYLAADLKTFDCPHHVQSQGVAPAGSADHSNHQGHGKTQAADPGAQPGDRDFGLRCCCRLSLDGLITTLVLDTPADTVNGPLPESVWRIPLFAELSIPENDLPTPFQPPRV